MSAVVVRRWALDRAYNIYIDIYIFISQLRLTTTKIPIKCVEQSQACMFDRGRDNYRRAFYLDTSVEIERFLRSNGSRYNRGIRPAGFL